MGMTSMDTARGRRPKMDLVMATRAVDAEFARRRARVWFYVIVAVLLGVGIASAVRADGTAGGPAGDARDQHQRLIGATCR